MLKGITRKNIIEVCKSNGIPVEERIISIEELKTAKEAFITSSTKRIIPVHQIDDFTYMLNRPDSVAKKVYDLLVGLE
jgi:branched-subunit amino acid aminotransferase/4-amino-4-deoxychorismate lyase